jgi:hypothetical protein
MRGWDFKDNHLPAKVGAVTMFCNIKPHTLPFPLYCVPFDDVTPEDVVY